MLVTVSVKYIEGNVSRETCTSIRSYIRSPRVKKVALTFNSKNKYQKRWIGSGIYGLGPRKAHGLRISQEYWAQTVDSACLEAWLVDRKRGSDHKSSVRLRRYVDNSSFLDHNVFHNSLPGLLRYMDVSRLYAANFPPYTKSNDKCSSFLSQRADFIYKSDTISTNKKLKIERDNIRRTVNLRKNSCQSFWFVIKI